MIDLLSKRTAAGETFDISQQIASAVEPLTAKVAQLKKANNYLTRTNKVKPRLRIVLQASGAADLLALWHLTGYRTGRIACQSYGLSDRAWHYGRALLQVARVWGHGREGWLSDDPNEIETALRVAVERCEKNPEILIARLPQSRALKPVGTFKNRRKR
jgi:hypothetical protein